MFERYTEKSRRAIFFARYEASQTGCREIGTGHLLLGILREDTEALSGLWDRDLAELEAFRASLTQPGAEKLSTSVDLPLSQEARRALACGAEEAEALHHAHIGNEHLLIGLARVDDSAAALFLTRHGADLAALRRIASEAPQPGGGPSGWDVMEHLKRTVERLGARHTAFQQEGDIRQGRFSATRMEEGVRVVESHTFVGGHQVRVSERMSLSEDGTKLHYTIEINGPGQTHKHEIDFPIG